MPGISIEVSIAEKRFDFEIGRCKICSAEEQLLAGKTHFL